MSGRKAVLYGTIVVGLLDILDAIVFFRVRSGVAPIRILQSIAAGLVGRQAAFAGGMQTALLGASLHFFIAFAVVLTYYLASRRLRVLRRRAVVCGLLYGLGVYAVMNFIVIPLSAAPARGPAPTDVLVNGLLIHAFGVGLPASLFARAARK